MSFFEWVQNLQNLQWDDEEVSRRLDRWGLLGHNLGQHHHCVSVEAFRFNLVMVKESWLLN